VTTPPPTGHVCETPATLGLAADLLQPPAPSGSHLPGAAVRQPPEGNATLLMTMLLMAMLLWAFHVLEWKGESVTEEENSSHGKYFIMELYMWAFPGRCPIPSIVIIWCVCVYVYIYIYIYIYIKL